MRVTTDVGRRIEQYQPVYFDLRPFPQSEVYPLEPRRYYFDFGDGTNVISTEQVVSHVYTGFGTFSVRMVETDTPTNITSGATICEFEEIVIYVYPSEYPLSFEFANNVTGQNSSVSPYLVLDTGVSVWELTLIDYSNRALDNVLTRMLQTIEDGMSLSTTDSNVQLNWYFDESIGKYLVEIRYLSTKVSSFDITVTTESSVGIVRRAYTKFSFSAFIGMKFEKAAEARNLTKTARVPHSVDSLVGIDDNGKLLFSANCFYDFSELGPANVADVAASTTAMYYVSEGKLYGRSLMNMYTEQLILEEAGTLFSAPPSNFLNPENEETGENSPYDTGGVVIFVTTKKDVYILENMVPTRITDDVKKALSDYDASTNVLLATCYLDYRVIYMVTYKNRAIKALILDLNGRKSSQVIETASDCDEPAFVFQHDLTKQTFYCFDGYVSVAEEPRSTLVTLMDLPAQLAGYACSIARDGVVLWTETGAVLLIAPEFQMSTTLVTLSDTTFTLLYDSTDQLILHVGWPYAESTCIPMDSILKLMTLDDFNGSILCVTSDRGETLSFGLCSPTTYSIVSEDLDLGHYALYGDGPECSFGSAGSECHIVNFGRVIQTYSTTMTLSDTTLTSFAGDFPGFTEDLVGIEISLLDIGVLVFVVGVQSKDIANVVKVSGAATSGTVHAVRIFDLRDLRKVSCSQTITFGALSENGQQATIDPNNEFMFSPAMAGQTIEADRYKLVIITVLDKWNILTAPSVGEPAIPKQDEKLQGFSIFYDPEHSLVSPILTRPWTLQYQDCADVNVPDLMNIISVRNEQGTVTHSFNISASTKFAVRTLSNDDVSISVASTPYNATFTIDFDSLAFGMTQFVATIPDYSPKCQHLFAFGLTKYCSAGQQFTVSVSAPQEPIPYINYRPPSVAYGLLVSVSERVYNVVPEEWTTVSHLKDRLKMSQGIAKLNACEGAKTTEECKCTAASDILQNPSESNCIRTARSVRMGAKLVINYMLEEFIVDHWEQVNVAKYITIEEVNNRTDFCAKSDCSSGVFNIASGDSITLVGPELYHFKLTAQSGNCVQTSYLVVWATATNLKRPIFYMTAAAFFILFILILEAIFLCRSGKSFFVEESQSRAADRPAADNPAADNPAADRPADISPQLVPLEMGVPLDRFISQFN